jgi:hypothetical protein
LSARGARRVFTRSGARPPHSKVAPDFELTITNLRLKMYALIAGTKDTRGSFESRMAISKDDAVAQARNDLAKRLKIDASGVKEKSVEDSDFPDMALGAAEDGEMSGQMITRGWRIQLEADGKSFEYRADKNQVRAYKFKGKNYRI